MNLISQGSLYSTQVDFKNAFVQAPLERPMYMTLPPGLADQPQYQDKVLKLKRSLYGHKYAAKLFYELIRKVLVERMGFRVSNHDHCLFLWEDCIIITWVDDAIIITKEEGKANAIIEEMQKHELDLDKQGEGGLADYLGINNNHLDKSLM